MSTSTSVGIGGLPLSVVPIIGSIICIRPILATSQLIDFD